MANVRAKSSPSQICIFKNFLCSLRRNIVAQKKVCQIGSFFWQVEHWIANGFLPFCETSCRKKQSRKSCALPKEQTSTLRQSMFTGCLLKVCCQEVLRLTSRICSCGRFNRNCSCGRLNRNCSCGKLNRNWNSNLWKFNCRICNFGRLFFLIQAWPRSSYEKKTFPKNRKETPKLKHAFCLKKKY